MARQKPLLTDQQWAKIKSLLPSERPGPKGGRPRCNNRKVLEGIRWVLKTGARWRDLPPEGPLIEPTLDASAAPEKIQRLIYDKAADSNALRQRLATRGSV